MKLRGFWLSMLLLAVPLPAAGQLRPSADTGAVRARGPLEMLLRTRDQLVLTPEQVTRLEEAQDRLDELNRPLLDRLTEMRAEWRRERPTRDGRPVPVRELSPEERERLRGVIEEGRPLLKQIRRNNRDTMREVGEILTRPQKLLVRAWLQMQRDRRRPGRGPGLRPGFRLFPGEEAGASAPGPEASGSAPRPDTAMAGVGSSGQGLPR